MSGTPEQAVLSLIDWFIPGRGNSEELGLVKDGGGFHLVGDILQLLVIQRGGHPESQAVCLLVNDIRNFSGVCGFDTCNTVVVEDDTESTCLTYTINERN